MEVIIVDDNIDYLYFSLYRWVLLCFKREFPERDALRIWEACWSHYQSDYFHLFVCVAIISVYGEDVTEQNLPSDEMLLHFSSLSMHMSGEVILKKVVKQSTCNLLVIQGGYFPGNEGIQAKVGEKND